MKSPIKYAGAVAGSIALSLAAGSAMAQEKPKDNLTQVSFEGTRYHVFNSDKPICLYNQRGNSLRGSRPVKKGGDIVLAGIDVITSDEDLIKHIDQGDNLVESIWYFKHDFKKETTTRVTSWNDGGGSLCFYTGLLPLNEFPL